MNIEIVSGSARQQSITLRAAKYLQAHLKKVASTHNIGLIDLKEFPMPFIDKVYSTPAQAPVEIQPLAERMFQADAFILVTPEYNGTIAPALTNWFGHFPKQLHKPFGLVAASNGALGGIRAARDLQHFVLALFGVPCAQMLAIGEVDKKFDATGKLLAETFQSRIDTFVAEFIWLAEKIHE